MPVGICQFLSVLLILPNYRIVTVQVSSLGHSAVHVETSEDMAFDGTFKLEQNTLKIVRQEEGEGEGGRRIMMEFTTTGFWVSWRGRVKNCHGGRPVNCETNGAIL